MKYCFGDIVVINKDKIGVVVKCWQRSVRGREPSYDVYCRILGEVVNFPESEVQRYMVRHKYLDEEELQWQANAQIN